MSRINAMRRGRLARRAVNYQQDVHFGGKLAGLEAFFKPPSFFDSMMMNPILNHDMKIDANQWNPAKISALKTNAQMKLLESAPGVDKTNPILLDAKYLNDKQRGLMRGKLLEGIDKGILDESRLMDAVEEVFKSMGFADSDEPDVGDDLDGANDAAGSDSEDFIVHTRDEVPEVNDAAGSDSEDFIVHTRDEVPEADEADEPDSESNAAKRAEEETRRTLAARRKRLEKPRDQPSDSTEPIEIPDPTTGFDEEHTADQPKPTEEKKEQTTPAEEKKDERVQLVSDKPDHERFLSPDKADEQKEQLNILDHLRPILSQALSSREIVGLPDIRNNFALNGDVTNQDGSNYYVFNSGKLIAIGTNQKKLLQEIRDTNVRSRVKAHLVSFKRGTKHNFTKVDEGGYYVIRMRLKTHDTAPLEPQREHGLSPIGRARLLTADYLSDSEG